jgi:hypothetical protein
VNHNITNLDETSSVCSLEENLDLEALNLICYKKARSKSRKKAKKRV